MMAVAFGLVLLTNRLTVYLSVVGVLLAASYPFLKRYTYLPQLYLGLAFGWGIPMAFAAVQGKVPELAWLLFLGNLLWTTGYDTWYAMVDREDDLRAGAKSTAILFGETDLIAQAVIYGSFLVTMMLLGGRAGLGFIYLGSLGAAAGFIAWQFAVARYRRPADCFRAFLANQWVGLVVFLGIALDLASR
jgi:4-hydroxybenzoate polyprenyltransferase